MKLPLLLAFSVIGAVAIGGALTGTTLATWRDTATTGPAVVEAGNLRLQVNASSAATLPAVTGLQPGVPQMRVLTVTNDGVGRNLRMVARSASVTVSGATPLELAFRARTSGSDSCSAGTYTPLVSGTVLTQPLAAGASTQLCLSVSTKAVPYQSSTSTVTLGLTGTQVRP